MTIADFNTFVLIRDSIDILLSMGVEVDHFGKYYIKYVEDIKKLNVPFVKYENLSTSFHDEIEKLNQLLKDGVLTQEEFEKAKKKLLDN